MKGYAVITGASSGIGAEFARQLAKKGYPLILTGRRMDKLQELAQEVKVDCVIMTADLSKKVECYKFFSEIRNEKIDIFINFCCININMQNLCITCKLLSITCYSIRKSCTKCN